MPKRHVPTVAACFTALDGIIDLMPRRDHESILLAYYFRRILAEMNRRRVPASAVSNEFLRILAETYGPATASPGPGTNKPRG